jgi:hypothetical protein
MAPRRGDALDAGVAGVADMTDVSRGRRLRAACRRRGVAMTRRRDAVRDRSPVPAVKSRVSVKSVLDLFSRTGDYWH